MKAVLFLWVISAFTLFSCGEYPCTRASSRFVLIGFPENETDTVIVRKYVKGTSFTTLLDTFLLDSHNNSFYQLNDSLEITAAYGTDNGLTSEYDYQIALPNAGKTYQLTKITEEIRTIRTGLSMDKVGCINPVKSYELNGRLISGSNDYYFFYIRK